MYFSKTFYKNQNSRKKIKLELSKTAFGKFNYNKKPKSTFYYGKNLNSFSMDTPIKTSSNNIITNKTLKELYELKSSKSTKDTIINNRLQNFHTEAIKIKIRKNKKYKSLFDKIDISSPNENIFLSPQLKKAQKKLINLKLKYNKNRIFNHIFKNEINSINLNNSGNIKKINKRNEKGNILSFDNNMNNNLNSNKLLTHDINKTHFTTYYPSFGLYKSDNKNISTIKKNSNYIINTEINNKKTDINNDLENYKNIKINDNKIILKSEEENNNRLTIKNFIIQNENINNQNNLNTFSSNAQSFITSINYIQTPPYPVEFRDQNLLDFSSKTRDLRYIKYFVFVKKNKLKNAREKKQYMSTLLNIDILKFIHFYKLFKPYNHYLEKYLIFLKEEINKEYKENQKLKLIKNKLLTEVISDKKKLLHIHKRLRLYLNDKFFLLCVKNSSLNIDLFEEKDKIEFEQDLNNFEILKKYINELSEITFNESLLGVIKKASIINNYASSKKLSKIYNANSRHSYSRKKTNRLSKNNEKFLVNIFKNSRIHFKPSPIFESVNEFNDYMNNSRKKIEYLLMEDNKIGIEVANLRDYYLLHQEDINKTKYNKCLLSLQFDKLNQELSDLKNYNSKLILHRNNLIKNKQKKIYTNVIKKIVDISNKIYEQYNININKIINLKNIGKPLSILKDIENVIIYLINFKEEQRLNNRDIYNEEIKRLDKNKRLAIIKKKKEEDEHRIENKVKELIEKDMKILNINNRKNIRYKPFSHKKKKKEDNIEINKNSVDISY